MTAGSVAEARRRVEQALETLELWRHEHGYYQVMYGEVSMPSMLDPRGEPWSEAELRHLRELERAYRHAVRQYEREQRDTIQSSRRGTSPGYGTG